MGLFGSVLGGVNQVVGTVDKVTGAVGRVAGTVGKVGGLMQTFDPTKGVGAGMTALADNFLGNKSGSGDGGVLGDIADVAGIAALV